MTAVAFVRSTGGMVRVLLAIDRNGESLYDGEPVLLVQHRPGAPLEHLTVEGPQCWAATTAQVVVTHAGAHLVEMIEAAFTDTGEFDGQRLLGRSVQLRAAHDHFSDEGV